jgi:two-component system chemotaxis response regulator CheB
VGSRRCARIQSRLPARLDAAVIVVLHVASTGTSALPEILGRAGALPVAAARDGEPVPAGRIVVAPPDRHVLVEDGRIRLSVGPRENGHRPSVDATLASLAVYGSRAVGVILSGTRDDGTRGMLAIARAGGRTFVQDAEEALFDGMICSVQRYVEVDAVLPVAEPAARLAGIAGELTTPASPSTMDPHPMDVPTDRSEERTATRYTCPDCGGAPWRHQDGHALSFKCSVGHAYSPESFDGDQGREIENALWAAARLLGDRRTLLSETADHAQGRGHGRTAAAFREQAAEVESAGTTIRRLIERGRLPLDAVTPDQPHA